MNTVTCAKCGKVSEIAPDAFLGESRRYCDPCVAIVRAEEETRERDLAVARLAAAFEKTVPLVYRETDLEHAGIAPAFRSAMETWDGVSGLGFTGKSGTGKTRLMFRVLMDAAQAGRSCDWISHNAFSKLVISAFGAGDPETRIPATRRLADLYTVDVLLIDDLGKAPSSERCDAELEELIETRVSWQRTTLWTANGGGAWLSKRFSADRGEPLVRRLAEFGAVIRA